MRPFRAQPIPQRQAPPAVRATLVMTALMAAAALGLGPAGAETRPGPRTVSASAGAPTPPVKLATLVRPHDRTASDAAALIPARLDDSAGSDAEAQPLVWGAPVDGGAHADDAFAYPPPLVLTETPEAPAAAPEPQVSEHLEAAFNILLELPLAQEAAIAAASLVDDATFGPDLGTIREAWPQDGAPPDSAAAIDEVRLDPAHLGTTLFAREGGRIVESSLHADPAAIFGVDPALFPPVAFEHHAAPDAPGADGVAMAAVSFAGIDLDVTQERDGIWPSPAERMELTGPQLAKARKCLAEAIYFESRGEPKRGQIAVAQTIVNRVFSGYYPKTVCGTVYQNAHRHLACQFTFACDNVKDVIREPDMWVQANEIAADMLDGKLWLDSVGRATHYHAYWVHPSWVREMNKLDRIGVHTFYRPRKWTS